jgi:hypothetical protein
MGAESQRGSLKIIQHEVRNSRGIFIKIRTNFNRINENKRVMRQRSRYALLIPLPTHLMLVSKFLALSDSMFFPHPKIRDLERDHRKNYYSCAIERI